MKTMRLVRFSSGLPVALQVAVEDHVHALEDVALRLVGKGEDALGAQDVRAVALHQLVDPGHEHGRDRPAPSMWKATDCISSSCSTFSA